MASIAVLSQVEYERIFVLLKSPAASTIASVAEQMRPSASRNLQVADNKRDSKLLPRTATTLRTFPLNYCGRCRSLHPPIVAIEQIEGLPGQSRRYRPQRFIFHASLGSTVA